MNDEEMQRLVEKLSDHRLDRLAAFIVKAKEKRVNERNEEKINKAFEHLEGYNSCSVKISEDANRYRAVINLLFEREDETFYLVRVELDARTNGNTSFDIRAGFGALSYYDDVINDKLERITGTEKWTLLDGYSLIAKLADLLVQFRHIVTQIYKARGSVNATEERRVMEQGRGREKDFTEEERTILDRLRPILLPENKVDDVSIQYTLTPIEERCELTFYRNGKAITNPGTGPMLLKWNRLYHMFPEYSVHWSIFSHEMTKRIISVAMPLYGNAIIERLRQLSE